MCNGQIFPKTYVCVATAAVVVANGSGVNDDGQQSEISRVSIR